MSGGQRPRDIGPLTADVPAINPRASSGHKATGTNPNVPFFKLREG